MAAISFALLLHNCNEIGTGHNLRCNYQKFCLIMLKTHEPTDMNSNELDNIKHMFEKNMLLSLFI